MATKFKEGQVFKRGSMKVKLLSVTGTDVYYKYIDPLTHDFRSWDMSNPIRLEHKDAERLLTPISKLERYLEGMDNEDAS